MLLNKVFITKVQNEHTCLNIISRIYSRSEEHLFRRTFTSSNLKSWRKLSNYLIIPSNLPCHILSKIINWWNKLFYTQRAEIDRLVITMVLVDIFLTLQFYPIILPLSISLKRKTYRDMKGKLIQLLESVLSVSWCDFNKRCEDFLREVGRKWCSNEIAKKWYFEHAGVWDESVCQIVLYEVISWKIEISWLHKKQTLKWLWRSMKWM